MEYYGYIYLTENKINHRWYIGQHHKKKFDTAYYGSGKTLKKALDKYGKENFTCTPIDWAYSKEELSEKEIWWITYFRTLSPYEGYNIADGGGFGFVPDLVKNKQATPEIRAKMSESAKRRCADPKERERLSKMSRENWNNPEYRNAIISSIKERHSSSEYLEKLSNSMIAYYDTPGAREKASNGQKRRYENKQERENTSKATAKFYENNPQAREEISKRTKDMWKNPEHITKICSLTEDTVMDILTMLFNRIPFKEIAEKFGVKRSAISKIKRGQNYSFWTDLTNNNYKDFWQNAYS